MNAAEMLELFKKLSRKAQHTHREALRNEKYRKFVGVNYFGGKSLRIDTDIEEIVKRELRGIGCNLITEEQPGKLRGDAEYLFVLDPLDGSNNFFHGFPAYAFAICGLPLKQDLRREWKPTSEDIVASLVMNLADGSEYTAVKGAGSFLNGKRLNVRKAKETKLEPEKPLISVDVGSRRDLAAKLLPRLAELGQVRIVGAATMDLCFVARGVLDAFVDVRDAMLVTHVAGLHVAKEAGAIVTDKFGSPLCIPLEQNAQFSVVASKNKRLHSKLVELTREL